jgi:hypothetical protein
MVPNFPALNASVFWEKVNLNFTLKIFGIENWENYTFGYFATPFTISSNFTFS